MDLGSPLEAPKKCIKVVRLPLYLNKEHFTCESESNPSADFLFCIFLSHLYVAVLPQELSSDEEDAENDVLTSLAPTHAIKCKSSNLQPSSGIHDSDEEGSDPFISALIVPCHCPKKTLKSHP